jgi:hypothetical protein
MKNKRKKSQATEFLSVALLFQQHATTIEASPLVREINNDPSYESLN